MTDSIRETLEKLLGDPSPAVREAATASLDRIRARRSAAESRKALDGGTPEERMRIVYAAAEMGGAEGASLLVAALSNDDQRVRGAAARALGDFPSPHVLKAMAARLPQEQGVVLANLLESLGRSRRKELAPVVERYLSHPDAEVAGRAAVAYGMVADPEGVGKLLPLVSSGREEIRAGVARALAEFPLS